MGLLRSATSHAAETTGTKRRGRALRRLLACALAPLALLAAAEPGPPGPSVQDHVYTLAGNFTCRTLQRAVTHITGTRAGDVITTHADVASDNGSPASIDDRYTLDPATRRWKLEMGIGLPRMEFTADAEPWTGETWTVEGRAPNDRRILMITKLLPNGEYRRVFAVRANGGWETSSATRCTPGDTAPAADACIVPNYPPHILGMAVGPEMRSIPPGQPQGVVEVVVSLDADSHVTGTRVKSSPSAFLSSAVIAAARRTTYQTEIRECKPVASEYLYNYQFGR